MPMYDYKCSKCSSRIVDVITKYDENLTITCRCGGTAERQIPNRFSVHCNGLRLEAMSAQIKGRHKKPFSTERELYLWEQDNGLRRIAEDSSEYRRIIEYNANESQELQRTMESDGFEGLSDEILKRDVLEATSFSTAEFCNWRDLTNEFEQGNVSGGTSGSGNQSR